MTVETVFAIPVGVVPPATATAEDEGEAVVEAIASNYVQRLRAAGSPLIATDELSAERADYARSVVRAVLTALTGPVGESPSLDTRRAVVELADSGIRPGVALAGAALLFETALTDLDLVFPGRNVEIAICLAQHLLFGIALVLDSAGVTVRREDVVTEIVDSSLLHSTLSKREAAVFLLLVNKVPTNDIAAQLNISPVTLKHHISSIGRKLGGRGRVEVLRRARELGILVAAPLAASGTITALNALAGN